MNCFYDPTTHRVIDTVNAEGLSSICKETLEQVKLRHPGAELWDFDKACEQKMEWDRAKYTSAPKQIDEERFFEMLEVLPPMKWKGSNETESFMISEALTADIRSIFCRIGEKFFEMCDTQYLSHDEIVEKCMALV